LFPNEAEFNRDSINIQGISDLGRSKIRMKYDVRSSFQQRHSVNLWCNCRGLGRLRHKFYRNFIENEIPIYLEECLWKKEGEYRYNMRGSLAILAEKARKTCRKE
jgi:hypothetical protein